MPNPVSRRGRPPYPDTLTPSEWTILHLVRHGLTNRQIASARRTTIEAVKFHLGNIVAKVGIRDRTALRQWTGIPAHMRASREEQAVTDTPGIQGVGQVGIQVHDINRAVEFYRDVLSIPHMLTAGHLAVFDCGGVRLFVTEPEEGREWQPASVIYYRVLDIHAAHAALLAAGVPFESAPHLIHRFENGAEDWMAFCYDPDRNMLALMAQLPAPGTAPAS